MKNMAIILAIILGTAACSYINQKLKLQDDNLAEELIEEAIHLKTGFDVDLTPGTPE